MADEVVEHQTDEVPMIPIQIIGLGGGGVRAVAEMLQRMPQLNALVVDTDPKTLAVCQTDKCMQIGESVTDGFSAGGSVDLGRQAVEKEASALQAAIKHTKLLILVGGLGGGTASGAMPVIARWASTTNKQVLCFVSLPFEFEGIEIKHRADDAMRKLRTHADAVVQLPSARLVAHQSETIKADDAFALIRETMAEGIFSLWRMLSQSGVCGLDYASIHTMLRNCDGYCHMAISEQEGENRAEKLSEQVVRHPLLANGMTLRNSSGIIVAITGGHDLRLHEIDQVMKKLQHQIPDDAWIRTGITIDEHFIGKISVMLLSAERWREPLMRGERGQDGFTYSRHASVEQGLLSLDASEKGRFDETTPTIYDNEDLDRPAFVRKNIKLPR